MKLMNEVEEGLKGILYEDDLRRLDIYLIKSKIPTISIRLFDLELNEELQKVKDTVNEQKVDCQATIQENEGLILNYKKLIQDLEKQNEALRALVISLNAQINVADNNVRELVYKLISKKTF